MIELVAAGMVGCVTSALVHYGPRVGEPSWRRAPSPVPRNEGPRSPLAAPGEPELRQALDAGDFVLRYEPVVDLATGRVAAFEALVHWRHWAQGLIQPEQFLPVAEKTGLIVPLGAWVLEESSRKLASWRSRFPEASDLSLTVNLSARELAEPGLAERVAGILGASSLPAGALMVEAREAATTSPEAVTNLNDLTALGVGLILDRVGTGSSTLGHVRRLQVRMLKVDRTLVAGVATAGREAALAAGYLGFGIDLGLAVAAVGVETTDQLAWLCQRGCTYAQGFLFAQPMDAIDVDGFLERRFLIPRLVGVV